MPAAHQISALPHPADHQREKETLTGLIGGIYDAALDPAAWSDVLPEIAAFAGGQACGFLSKDAANDFLTVEHYAGVAPHHLQAYAENFAPSDPLLMVPHCDPERIVSIPELVPFDEYRESRFCREWAQPQGWLDVANAVLDKSAAHCIIFSVVRDDASGLVDAELRRRLALVIPHVRRAALVESAIDRKQSEIAAFAATLDGLNAGLFLVDAEGRIVHANAAGRAILSGDDVLRSAGGRLVARDAAAQQSLRELFAAAGQGRTDLGRRGIALPLAARDGERHVAHLLPLSQNARARAGLGGKTAAAVFVRKAALAGTSPAEVVGKAFRLTPAELRVLLGIVDVGGVPEVATVLGVAESTVKTHLSRLFEKTGTARQADLVKLVAGFATPLVH
ncbi:MAG: LuxR C-terminal-related transcriptional regulator [Xanthobacteraceae bacterium]|nr:LuxR C-terminal-related transcriptional regulator [Xanthobacteraceae bacterium]